MGQNPNLCESTSCNQQTVDANKKKKKNNLVIPIVASVASVLVVLVVAAAAIIYGLTKRKPQGKTAANFHLQSLSLVNQRVLISLLFVNNQNIFPQN